jgi:hypothetical protein
MIDPNILLQSRPVDIETPLQAQTQAQNLTNLANQAALQRADLTAVNQQNQMRQTQMQDQQTLRQAFLDSNGNPDQLMTLARQRGVSPQTLMQLQGSLLDMKTKYAALDKDTLANTQTKNDQLQSLLAPVANETDPAKQETAWNSGIGQAISKGLMQPAEAAQHPYPGPDGVKNYVSSLNLEKWALSRQQLGTANQRNAAADQNYGKMISDAYAGVKNADDLNAANLGLMAKLPGKYANQLLTKYDPDAVAQIANANLSPADRSTIQHQRIQEQQAAANGQATQDFRKQQLGIEQQNANTNANREARESQQQAASVDPSQATPLQQSLAQGLVKGLYSVQDMRRFGNDGKLALSLAPALDSTWTENRYQTLRNFTTGKGADADALANLVMLNQHLDRLKQNSAALGTKINPWSQNATRVASDANDISGILGKLVKGGVLSVEEHNEYMGRLNSPLESVRDSAADEMKELVAGKVAGLQQKFKNGAGYDMPASMLGSAANLTPVAGKPGQPQPQPMPRPVPVNPNPAPQPAAAPRVPNGSVSVTDPRGVTHWFANQAAADNFKRLAGIR